MENFLVPGVVMSFDDYCFIEDWIKVKKLFKRFDARVTFFINAPDEMTQEHWDSLNELVKDGHVIGCHSLRHAKALDYSQEHSCPQWVENEVVSALNIIKEHGFDVKSFAYPCSQNNEATDAAIMPYFKHARTGAFLSEGQRFVDLDIIFKPLDKVKDSFLLPAKGIDRLEDLSMIDEAARRARDENELLFLLGHRIGIEEDGKDNLHLTDKDKLEQILEIIKSYGLCFYTFNDLP